ncbi:MAG: hypothetical protein IPJ77_20660 [Planctomycetes bacterium]|nr:hypothetical protein [Planctomycetota bacterium]
MKLEALVPLTLLLAACAQDAAPAPAPSEPAAAVHAGSQAAPAAAPLAVRARSKDPELVRLRSALEFGRLAEAEALLPLAARAPDEAGELTARFRALQGKLFDALRLLEAERTARPKDAAVYAALAELYAGEQKFETAWSELKRGDEACGPSAELARARGVLWILREGGAKKGLEFLDRARAADPDLAFAARALGQAHLLLAKQAAKSEDVVLARHHVDRSLAYDAREVDALRLQADLQAAAGDFTSALATLEALVRGGESLGSELALLYKKGAFGALLAKNRPLALERFAKARALGLTDAELASGAQILADEARARREAGVAEYERGALAEAEAAFRAALGYDPGDLGARNHLAVVLFKQHDPAGAAEHWRQVLDGAKRVGIELPEPVHVNLAKALVQAGKAPEAEAVLDTYLAAEPEGRWAASTRAALEHLRGDAAPTAPR